MTDSRPCPSRPAVTGAACPGRQLPQPRAAPGSRLTRQHRRWRTAAGDTTTFPARKAASGSAASEKMARWPAPSANSGDRRRMRPGAQVMVTVNDRRGPTTARRAQVTTPPDDQHQLTGVLARAAEAPAGLLGDMLFQRLLRHRIIFLGQQVDDDLANRICAELILLASEDSKADISLYINSPGGSVYAGMAIYDVMQYVPNDVATFAMGMAASMGQFLLCAGAKGKRYALPHAQILLHQPHGGIGGTETDIRIQAKQILEL